MPNTTRISPEANRRTNRGELVSGGVVGVSAVGVSTASAVAEVAVAELEVPEAAAPDSGATGGLGGASGWSTGMLTTPLCRSPRPSDIVSPGLVSGRRRDSGVALVELPQWPQNMAPSGRAAPQMRHLMRDHLSG
ncbi:hypothetical protein GCM10009750_29900 [Agromyces salentinus]|uniref:Uncharacterized protein n=1 Tax=Agromyces salentinus TaxID=269421 RepID=A0ABN2MZT7_9MICO